MRTLWPLLLLLSLSGPARAAIDRPLDPLVLTGADLPGLMGAAPGSLVAFRWQGGWLQIPLQIDERHEVPFEQVYAGAYGGALVALLAYSDAGTHTGADPDAGFDANDELVLMLKDTGDAAPIGSPQPAGTVAGSGFELRIDDPLDSTHAYAYVFASDGSLAPGAGTDYVSYVFDLLAGSYPDDYDLAQGPNPEDSRVVTPRYEAHFSDRWIQDELAVKVGAATGVDILDRHRNLFGPGVCQRSEDSFSAGEGAFVSNRDGPVRAIRSYLGANSGPLTQRSHFFYAGRQDITTFLRVHAIPGMLDLFDRSPAAIGMTWYDSLTPAGVPVDGIPDAVGAGSPAWELITGAQGSVTTTLQLDTSVAGLLPGRYYQDDSTPSDTQCTGDAFEYAQSGLWIDQSIPNTDPRTAPFAQLTGSRILRYEEPFLAPAVAVRHAQQTASPVIASVQAFTSAVPGLAPAGLVILAAAVCASGLAARPR